MAQKKFYAIAVGRKPGIYDNWPQARVQVLGFPGAVYKGFASKEEAEAWLENPPSNSTRRKRLSPVAGRVKTEHPVQAGSILVYCDGGARNNPGPGGYGIVIVDGERRREITGGFNHTTNNRMELTGCIVALRALNGCNRPISLYTDSSYVVNGISKGWAKNWRRRGWIKSDGKPALNSDLWDALLNLLESCDVSFHWVKGHAGHPENERCDQLAVAASYRQNLPEDSGYRG
ncbi:MAG: ribonuclease HI [Deltaproteobacteria bacterium]